MNMAIIKYLLSAVLALFICAPAGAQGIISTIAGNGVTQYIGDGWPATAYSLAAPSGVCVDRSGNVFVADYADSRIRKVTPTDTLSTIGDTSGTPGYTGDGGIAVNAQFNNPAGICIDTNGNLYISEEFNNVIRKIDKTTGLVSTVCGSAMGGYAGDGGPATAARMNQPAGVCVDKAGNIYFADKGNSCIRKVTVATGTISTIAGSTTSGYSGDNGPATNAKLSFPRGVCANDAGDIYIADYGNNRIRRVDAATGIITTVAGLGPAGYSGDGGMAFAAKLSTPNNVFIDKHGNLFISDYGNNVIRMVAGDGKITTVAGNGSNGYSGDGGPPTAATFYGPTAVFVDDSDHIYIADGTNSAIRLIKPDVTAVNDVLQPGQVLIFPDPSSGIFTVATPLQGTMVRIYDATGRKVSSIVAKDKETVADLTAQAPGIYYVQVLSGNTALSGRVVIMR